MVISTGAATFGVIVPATMYMEIREIDYSNLYTGNNEVIIRQIPSGVIRNTTAIILDDANLAPPATSSPYSPRIPVRTVQENCVIEASSTAGPAKVTTAYRLMYGRP